MATRGRDDVMVPAGRWVGRGLPPGVLVERRDCGMETEPAFW